MYIVLIIALALLVIIFISVAKVYRSIPLIELKRRAKEGHEPSKSLYKVASYKFSSQFVLYFLATIASAIFFVYITKKSPLWVALTASLALIWLAYIWIPRSAVNIVSEYLAQAFAKPLGWLLQYIHPFISIFGKKTSKPSHTGLYERSDLVRLLSAQKKQEDNRIDAFELDLLKHVVGFGDMKVSDVMTPKRKVNGVPAGEVLGPLVLTELHKTNHTHFPVYEGRLANIVGILNITGISSLKLTVTADEAMSPSVYYVHEDQSLGEVLQIIIETSQELMIVINSNQDYVGIITGREILKSLVGEVVADEFERYDDKEFVAKRFDQQPVQQEELVIEEVSQEDKTSST